MPSRAERRRQSKRPDADRWSFLASREVVTALVLGVGVLGIVGAVLLLSGGGDEGTSGTTTSGTTTPGPSFSPSNEDEAAIAALAEKSIEVLPQSQWPTLYDDFTAEFQARCPKDEFIQAGIDAAQEQGANLQKLGFVRVDEVSVDGDRATATITGEVKGSFEYQVFGAFQKQDGVWKLSAAEGTSGCQAFNRP